MIHTKRSAYYPKLKAALADTDKVISSLADHYKNEHMSAVINGRSNVAINFGEIKRDLILVNNIQKLYTEEDF